MRYKSHRRRLNGKTPRRYNLRESPGLFRLMLLLAALRRMEKDTRLPVFIRAAKIADIHYLMSLHFSKPIV